MAGTGTQGPARNPRACSAFSSGWKLCVDAIAAEQWLRCVIRLVLLYEYGMEYIDTVGGNGPVLSVSSGTSLELCYSA